MKTIIVIGQPRSGTSVTIGMLKIMGVDLGGPLDERVDPPVHLTPTFENYKVMNINNSLLAKTNGSLFYPPDEIGSDDNLDLQLQEFVAQNKSEIWGFKDPRFSYTFDIWKKYLPNPYIVFTRREDEKLVDAILRYSFTMEHHVIRANIKKYKENVKRWAKEYPHFFMDFEKLMKNPLRMANRMAKFIGVKLTEKQKEEIKRFVVKH